MLFRSPLRASGGWIPELVRRAGGWDLLGAEGMEAPATSWSAIGAVDPELLVLAPGGMPAEAARRAWERLERPAAAGTLRAVRSGAVHAIDGGPFAHPGPRVIEAVAALARLIDPDGFPEADHELTVLRLTDGTSGRPDAELP